MADESTGADCEFCSIVRGDTHARIVTKFDGLLAFFPYAPATLGHTLLIPTAHVADLWSLEARTASDFARALLPLAEAIRRAFQPDGMNIIHSTGEAASQSVMHFHVHLVPRWTDDRIGDIWPPQQPTPAKVLDEALSLLQQELA